FPQPSYIRLKDKYENDQSPLRSNKFNASSYFAKDSTSLYLKGISGEKLGHANKQSCFLDEGILASGSEKLKPAAPENSESSNLLCRDESKGISDDAFGRVSPVAELDSCFHAQEDFDETDFLGDMSTDKALLFLLTTKKLGVGHRSRQRRPRNIQDSIFNEDDVSVLREQSTAELEEDWSNGRMTFSRIGKPNNRQSNEDTKQHGIGYRKFAGCQNLEEGIENAGMLIDKVDDQSLKTRRTEERPSPEDSGEGEEREYCLENDGAHAGEVIGRHQRRMILATESDEELRRHLYLTSKCRFLVLLLLEFFSPLQIISVNIYYKPYACSGGHMEVNIIAIPCISSLFLLLNIGFE
ncbi:unnamed protein product, partial [Protopolystoma xenopodis]